jgi:hypothetical protein
MMQRRVEKWKLTELCAALNWPKPAEFQCTLSPVDNTATLESIAKLLPGLPPENVEDILVNFDTLTSLGDDSDRPAAAQFLRAAAALCGEQTRKDRLLKAADSLLAGERCALTPDGLSWKQAAAAQTITLADQDMEELDYIAVCGYRGVRSRSLKNIQPQINAD